MILWDTNNCLRGRTWLDTRIHFLVCLSRAILNCELKYEHASEEHLHQTCLGFKACVCTSPFAGSPLELLASYPAIRSSLNESARLIASLYNSRIVMEVCSARQQTQVEYVVAIGSSALLSCCEMSPHSSFQAPNLTCLIFVTPFENQFC